jgi:hypothetical protein
MAMILVNTLYAGSSTGIDESGSQVRETLAVLAFREIGTLFPMMFDSHAPPGAASSQMA